MTRKTLLMVMMMAVSLGVSAQGSHHNPTFDLKKHQFGFGIGTTLLDNVGTFNQYLKTVGHYGRNYSLQTMQSSLFTVYFDYQYRFNDNWSIEARLKYKQRHTLQSISFAFDGSYGNIGSLESFYRDIAVPVTANYRWVTRAGSSFELFAGAGLTTLGLSVKSPTTIGFSDSEDTHAIIGIQYDRHVDIYGVMGFQFEIPYGAFTLKPFVSLSYSPRKSACYTVTPVRPTSSISARAESTPMHLCELECGMTMQF